MNNVFSKLLLTVPLFLILSGLHAQETSKQQEIGLTFTNFNQFGVTYRLGKNDKLWRFNLLQSHVSEDEASDEDEVFQSENFSLEAGMGREKRKSISDKFSVRYGMDLSLSFTRDKSLRFGRFDSSNDFLSKTHQWGVRLGFIAGMNFRIHERVLLGAEMLPSFGYEIRNSEQESGGTFTERESSGYVFRLSNNGALLSLVYIF